VLPAWGDDTRPRKQACGILAPIDTIATVVAAWCHGIPESYGMAPLVRRLLSLTSGGTNDERNGTR
jgi:hypothetical protein